jgi:hypothetical protein
MNSRLVALALAVISLWLVRVADADGPWTTMWRAEVGVWHMAPAWPDGGMAVVAFLAWNPAGVANEAPYSVLWFEQQDETWVMYGWEANDFASAVEYAREVCAHENMWEEDAGIMAILANPPGGLGVGPDALSAEVDFCTGAVHSSLQLSEEHIAVLDNVLYEAELALFQASSVVADELVCWCPCTTSMSYGAWALSGTTTAGSVKTCWYTATQTCTRNCFGLYLCSCNGCITSTGCGTKTVYGAVTVLPGATCPGFGGAGTPTGNPPQIFPIKPPQMP